MTLNPRERYIITLLLRFLRQLIPPNPRVFQTVRATAVPACGCQRRVFFWMTRGEPRQGSGGAIGADSVIVSSISPARLPEVIQPRLAGNALRQKTLDCRVGLFRGVGVRQRLKKGLDFPLVLRPIALFCFH